MSNGKSGWLGVFVAGILGMSALSADEVTAVPEVTEIFRVSKVGRANVVETRELLMSVYSLVEKDFNVEVAKKRNALEKAYRGEQVRVIKKLEGSDPNGPLYLCAYKGEPSVFSIPGKPRKVGELTPALAITENGTHETKFTRTIEPKRDKPALEEAGSGGAVTFFGIPLVFDNGPSPKRPAASKGGKKKSAPAQKKEVTEVKTLKKYDAKISTEQLKDGPAMLSTALFVDLVKNGTVFKAKRTEDRRCQECRGFGRVADTMNRREPDGKMDCPDCGAGGKITWDVTYVVAW